jgi:hypothetical protein
MTASIRAIIGGDSRNVLLIFDEDSELFVVIWVILLFPAN